MSTALDLIPADPSGGHFGEGAPGAAFVGLGRGRQSAGVGRARLIFMSAALDLIPEDPSGGHFGGGAPGVASPDWAADDKAQGEA